MHSLSLKNKRRFLKNTWAALIIYGITITTMVCYLPSLSVHLSWDSLAYIDLDFQTILKTGVDEFRMPGYIWLIDIAQDWFENSSIHFLDAIIAFQIVFYLVSEWFFYKALKLYIKSDIISIVTTVFYYCSPATMAYTKAILTEAITISMLSILIYCLFRYLSKPSIFFGCTSVIISLIMVMTRPSSLIFLLILAGFFIVRSFYKKGRIIHMISASCALLAGSLVCLYAIAFNQQYGTFSLSNTLLHQKLYIAVDRGYYLSSTDTEVVATIQNSKKGTWDKMLVLYNLPLERRQLFYDEVFTIHRLDNLIDTSNIMVKTITDPFIPRFTKWNDETYYGTELAMKRYNYPSRSMSPFCARASACGFYLVNALFQPVTFRWVYFICLIETSVVIIKLIKKKAVWLDAGIVTCITGVLLTTFFGTCAEWARTAIAILPFAFIAYALLVQRIVQQL